MTIGIYLLRFKGTDKVYIGQSINIEKRHRDHIKSLKKGDSGKKLQNAYKTYGTPNIEILLECNISELNNAEIEAISIFNSYDNGFNSTIGGCNGPNLKGPDHGRALYSREQIIECFNLLVDTTLPFKTIESITRIPIGSIKCISRGTSHNWLAEEFPFKYPKLEALKGLRTKISNGANYQGIVYKDVISPEGITYEISNLSAFASEHNLHIGNLCSVLKGNRPTVQGWKIVTL